jgi:hypothetical protein
MFIGYNPIAIRWKNSFHKGFVENFMGYLLKKNFNIYITILERYLQNTERLIYSATPIDYRANEPKIHPFWLLPIMS